MNDTWPLIERYSKPFGQLAGFKKNLFDGNDAQLKRSLDLASRYLAQPRRSNCKICPAGLPSAPDFTKHGVPYVFCPGCGHLNGCHQDTEDYARQVYIDADYGAGYHSSDLATYSARVDAIYLPKVEFLVEILSALGEQPDALSYVDLGAGSGHFVAALSKRGFDASGAELSKSQVAHGNAIMIDLGYASNKARSERLVHVELDELQGFAAACPADVVSLVGVLEHLLDPHALLQALRGNPRVRYVFLSLPLYSLSVLIEAAFPNVAPRLLEGGHTHLFCDRSLEALETRHQLTRLAAWWFGSDSMDLFRALRLTLAENSDTAALSDEMAARMAPMLDELQGVVDRARFCSEVHLLYALRR
ncbi:MAG: class I SAM-dependent methyltransferase [Betaproteobacteria bacterium]|nr:class I SAM-dependent methyltransferase [Betaproteobacteria bacterium]